MVDSKEPVGFIMYFARIDLSLESTTEYQGLVRNGSEMHFVVSSSLEDFAQEIKSYRTGCSQLLDNSPPKDWREQEQRLIGLFTNPKDGLGKIVLDDLQREHPDPDDYKQAYERLARVNYELRPLTHEEEGVVKTALSTAL